MTDRNDHGQFVDGFLLELLLISKYTTNLKDRLTIQVLYVHNKFILEYIISFEV